MVLLFTCFATPLRLAFTTEDGLDWQIINGIVDVVFFMDMICIFNTAYYDEDLRLIEHRGIIALEYFQGWFLIDLLAIFPIGYL